MLVYSVAGDRRCAAARKAGLSTVPAVFIDGANYAEIALVARKRTKAEALANGIGITATKIDDIDFPSFSEEDRARLIETMNAMKDILEAAIPRAVENRGKPM